jgi:hypothetical protein
MASSTSSDLEDECVNGSCPPSSQDKIDSGQTLAVVSTVLMAVGVVAAGVGAGFLIFGGDDTAEPAQAQRGRLLLTAGPTPLGAGAHLTF